MAYEGSSMLILKYACYTIYFRYVTENGNQMVLPFCYSNWIMGLSQYCFFSRHRPNQPSLYRFLMCMCSHEPTNFIINHHLGALNQFYREVCNIMAARCWRSFKDNKSKIPDTRQKEKDWLHGHARFRLKIPCGEIHVASGFYLYECVVNTCHNSLPVDGQRNAVTK